MALADHGRRFAAYRVAPGLRERDRARVVGRTLMRAPGEMEFIAPELPQKFGRHLVRTHRNATCASGWLGTGDQARIDAQGCIRIRARGKDAVIRGGENSAVRSEEH